MDSTEQRLFVITIIAIVGVIIIGVANSPYLNSESTESNIGGQASMQKTNSVNPTNATNCTCNGGEPFTCPKACSVCCGGSNNVNKTI